VIGTDCTGSCKWYSGITEILLKVALNTIIPRERLTLVTRRLSIVEQESINLLEHLISSRKTDDTMADRRKTDDTMADGRKTDDTMADGRKTDDTMADRRKTDDT
jgi:hypothetical protein